MKQLTIPLLTQINTNQNISTHDKRNIFKTINNDPSSSGILDDIRDLRRYLLLVEGYVTNEVNND